jgi:hypothetical protein
MERGEKNFLERLGDAIPGLSGYRARDDRRTSDKRLREYLASRLDRVGEKLQAIKLEATNRGDLQGLNAIGLLDRRLHGMADSLRFATYGYSGLFDQMKIQESQLDALYAHDMKIVDAVEGLEKAADDPANAVGAMTAALQGLDDLLAERKALWDKPA